jgi:hypothetical protein
MRPSSAYDHAPTRDSAEQIKGGNASIGLAVSAFVSDAALEWA